jgi:hypothetical protein
MQTETSQSRIDANRANAQNSTGPKTEAGKATSCRNATKHGFSSTAPMVTEEQLPEFLELQEELGRDFQPVGITEMHLFKEMLNAIWNLHRIKLNRRRILLSTNQDQGSAEDPAIIAMYERLDRHQTRNERTYYRALNQLREIQTERALREQSILPSAPPLVKRSKLIPLTKRSQAIPQNSQPQPAPTRTNEQTPHSGGQNKSEQAA